MTLTLKSFGKVISNKVILPPIHLTMELHNIFAIQAEIDYMNAFLSILEEDKSYLTKEIMLNGQALAGCEDLFMYYPEMGEYKRLTVEQILHFWGQLYNVQVDTNKILPLIELTHVRNKKSKHLTLSERKRLQFARSLIQQTTIFIYKEPTYQLDLQSKQVFNRIIEKLVNNGGLVLIVTTSLEEGIRLASKVYRLNSSGVHEIEQEHENKLESEEVQQAKEEDVFQRRFEKISAKSEEKVILFDPIEVDFIETRERQTILHVNNEEFVSTVSLKDLEQKLHAYGFYRCHRSYLVNLQRVREVVVWSKNSYSLTLDNHIEQTVPLSKSKYGELKTLLNW